MTEVINMEISREKFRQMLIYTSELLKKNTDLDVYKRQAKYPAVTRDISMVMNKEIMVGEVEEVIRKRGGKLLESFELFDIYEGAQIKEGFKSVAYSIVFRDKTRTLEDKDVNTVMDKILAELEKMGRCV